jgi:hypothetical protein
MTIAGTRRRGAKSYASHIDECGPQGGKPAGRGAPVAAGGRFVAGSRGAPPGSIGGLLPRYDREHPGDMGAELGHEVAQEGRHGLVGNLPITGEHLR